MALSVGEEKLLDEAVHTIVSNHFLDILLLHQTSSCDVELFVARKLVAPPVTSSLAAGVETATAIDNEPSDSMNPVAGCKVDRCIDSLQKSLLRTQGSIRVISVHYTGLVEAR